MVAYSVHLATNHESALVICIIQIYNEISPVQTMMEKSVLYSGWL